jgi:hypothetical protein
VIIRSILSTFLVTILATSVYTSASLNTSFAAVKDPRWNNGSSCGLTDKNGKQTCCWREPIPGSPLGETYCQACEPEGTNCDDKELQYMQAPPTSKEGGVPQDGKVLDEPRKSPPISEQGGLPDNGVAEEPQTPSNGNNQNVPFEGGVLKE